MDAAAAVAPPEVAGRRFLGMMERRLIRATGVAGTLAPEVPAPMSECPSSTERAAAARAWHEGELPVGGLAPAATARRAQAQSFLPTVDWSRLLGRDGREPHPSDKTQLLPGCQAPLYGGTVGFGVLSGILGSASAYFTAIAVKGLDENVLCNPDYHKFIPPMKPVCHAVMRSDLDEMIGTYIGSSQGALTFFVAWGLYMGWEAHSRLSLRYQVIRELALEPMGPPTSQLAVVCASGFLTSQADVFLPWEVDSDNPWTEGQVFAVRFDTPVLLRLGTHLVGLLSRVANQAMVAAQVALAVSTPPTLCQTLLYSLVTELDDVFDLAIKRAEQAGRALAQQLVVPVPARPGPPRPATLVAGRCEIMRTRRCLPGPSWAQSRCTCLPDRARRAACPEPGPRMGLARIGARASVFFFARAAQRTDTAAHPVPIGRIPPWRREPPRRPQEAQTKQR
ncbi:unnamed protein product [Prorocentrum cordatum]|uniref:Uncharacterized protein n=1 Tax=Prorocentrum cordatum TaxID=2364126 RepID=A0ABN9U9L3_9DINO|nr:unnamed protein product [Polarella glacialis]